MVCTTVRSMANSEDSTRSATRLTCSSCDATWTGVSRCHCSECHRTFSGLGLFDRHRRGGKCQDPAGLRHTETGERLAYLSPDGIWQADPTKQRLAPIRVRSAGTGTDSSAPEHSE